MSKIKDSVKKITPFVKPYKFGFLTAILLIVIAAVFSAIAPRTEGLVITQLTNDSFDLIKGVNGASVNFKYITKIRIRCCIYNFMISYFREYNSNIYST